MIFSLVKLKVLMTWRKCMIGNSSCRNKNLWKCNKKMYSRKFITKRLSMNYKNAIMMTLPRLDNNTPTR